MAFVTNLTAMIVFMTLHDIDYGLGLALAISGSLGAYIGANYAVRLGARLIKPCLIITVVLMCGVSIYQAWF